VGGGVGMWQPTISNMPQKTVNKIFIFPPFDSQSYAWNKLSLAFGKKAVLSTGSVWLQMCSDIPT
jgi:hypothetical protein